MGNETPRLHDRTGAGDKICFCAGSVMVGLRNLGGVLESNLATTVICSDFSGNDRGNIVVQLCAVLTIVQVQGAHAAVKVIVTQIQQISAGCEAKVEHIVCDRRDLAVFIGLELIAVVVFFADQVHERAVVPERDVVRKHIVVDPDIIDEDGGVLPENGVAADDLQIVDIRCDLGGCLQAVAGDAGLIQINIRIIRILCGDVDGLAVLREMDAPNVQVQRTGRAVDCNGEMADLFVNI